MKTKNLMKIFVLFCIFNIYSQKNLIQNGKQFTILDKLDDEAYEVLIQKDNKYTNKYITIHSYGGKYYIYKPCDIAYNFSVEISSSFITLESFEKNNFEILKKEFGKDHIYYEIKQRESKTIGNLMLKKYKGYSDIYVFKIQIGKNKPSFGLFIDSIKAKDYKTLVNECKNSKSREFTFEKLALDSYF